MGHQGKGFRRPESFISLQKHLSPNERGVWLEQANLKLEQFQETSKAQRARPRGSRRKRTGANGEKPTAPVLNGKQLGLLRKWRLKFDAVTASENP
jgi:hypothetical protein